MDEKNETGNAHCFLCHAFWRYGGFFCSAGPGVFGCGESRTGKAAQNHGKADFVGRISKGI